MANGIRTGNPRGFNKVRSSMKVPKFDKHLKKAGGHIGRNVVEITIKMKTIDLMIKIIKLCLRNLDKICLCLHTVKWFQVLLFNTNSSIYQVFLSNTNNLYTSVWFQINNNLS